MSAEIRLGTRDNAVEANNSIRNLPVAASQLPAANGLKRHAGLLTPNS
jgi:hypothetical protein